MKLHLCRGLQSGDWAEGLDATLLAGGDRRPRVLTLGKAHILDVIGRAGGNSSQAARHFHVLMHQTLSAGTILFANSISWSGSAASVDAVEL